MLIYFNITYPVYLLGKRAFSAISYEIKKYELN
jgi:hypothetical protein